MKKDLVLVNADRETETPARAATAAGGQLLRVAKSSPQAFEVVHVPTIALTSLHDARLEATALRHSALSCLVKPVSLASVKEALDALAPVGLTLPLALAA